MNWKRKIVIVRHGQTDWAREGRHTGKRDVELNGVGETQARQLAIKLSDMRFSLVFSSPLQRAQRTAELAGFGDRLQLDTDLAEWDYGDYEGKTSQEIRQARPDWTVWQDGFPNGETTAQVSARADNVIERITVDEADGDILIFSHGHFLRILAARWIELEPSWGKAWVFYPGSVSTLGYEHEQRAIIFWNQG